MTYVYVYIDFVINITLENDNNEVLVLEYRVGHTPACRIWLESFKKATSAGLESSLFYNFKRPESQLEFLVLELEKCIAKLNETQPELQLPSLDQTSLQQSLNSLHTNFAHSHLIERSVSEKNREVWSRFNTLIHQIESAMVAKSTKAALDLCRIEFTFKQPFQCPIPPECFAEYTLLKKFGSIQINYCQVGRQITELFASQDENIPPEHILPARFFSANSTLWFGPDIPPAYEIQQMQKIEKWFQKNEKKFTTAGISWKDTNKAIGSVSVAQLINRFSTLSEQRQFQNKVAQYNRIKNVEFVD